MASYTISLVPSVHSINRTRTPVIESRDTRGSAVLTQRVLRSITASETAIIAVTFSAAKEVLLCRPGPVEIVAPATNASAVRNAGRPAEHAEGDRVVAPRADSDL